MNRASTFTLSPRIEDAYNAAQDFIANECPVLEQRLKRAALTFINYTLPIWIMAIQLFIVKAKRWFVRRAISVLQFSNYHGITAKASKVWARKGAIATSAMDKVFSLN